MQLHVTMDVPVETLMNDRDMAYLKGEGLTELSIPYRFYDMPADAVQKRGRELTAMGFHINTCHPPFGGGNRPNSLCAEVEEVRQRTIEVYTHYIRAFALTGMKVIPVHTGGAMHPAGGAKALDRLTDTLERLLPEAEKTGVILALENTFYANPCPFSDALNPSGVMEKFINDDCRMLADYVRAWNSPWIRVCMDVGHSQLYGHDPAEDLATLAPLVALYHIQDNDGVDDLHYNVGVGRYPWGMLRRRLQQERSEAVLFDEVLNDPDPEMRKILYKPERIVHYFRQAERIMNEND